MARLLDGFLGKPGVIDTSCGRLDQQIAGSVQERPIAGSRSSLVTDRGRLPGALPIPLSFLDYKSQEKIISTMSFKKPAVRAIR
ncbi:hypothetical protein AB3G45_28600 [Shinella sp. S4-D37]|uniref:hypothetical protein n=1 Tax=Shinella sp. S4-D37 TaxID=3161999 RepID=UPI003466503F